MAKNLSEKEFHKKLTLKNKYYGSYFNLVGNFINCRTKIEVSTLYGNCFVNPYNILEGNKPSISTAIEPVKFFINMAKEIHNSTYDYSCIKNYVNNITKVPIICKTHGLFLQKPNNHLLGNGCPECGKKSWDFKLNDWLNTNGSGATFYILKCSLNDEEFIKMGITSTTIKKRYRKKDSMPYNYIVLHETYSTNKKLIWELERTFLRELRIYKYKPLLKFGGSTECFKLNSLKHIQLSHASIVA